MQLEAKNMGRELSQQVLYNFVRNPCYFSQRTVDELRMIHQSLLISLQHIEGLSQQKEDSFRKLLNITDTEIEFRQEVSNRSNRTNQEKSKNEASTLGWFSNNLGSMFSSSNPGQSRTINGFGSKLVNLFKKQESFQNVVTKQQEQEQFLHLQSTQDRVKAQPNHKEKIS